MAAYTGWNYDTGLKYLSDGIDEIGKAQQRRSLADAASGLDGTAEGYTRVARGLAARGDMAAASQFLTLAETVKKKSAVNSIFTTPTNGASTGGARSIVDATSAGGDYYGKTSSVESGNNTNAKNPNSTATGQFQFLQGTWADLAKRRPDLGLTPDGRTDPKQGERAMRAFTEENAGVLRKAGIEPTDANLYTAHFLGAGDATNFLGALRQDPTMAAAEVVNPRAAAANRTIFYRPDGAPKTVAEVYGGFQKRLGSGSTAFASQPSAPVQTAQASGVASDAADTRPKAGAPAEGFSVPGMPKMPANLRPDIPDERLVSISDDPRAKYLLEERRRWREQNDPDKRELTRLDIETKRRALAKSDTPESIREFEIAKERGYTTAKTPGEFAREKLAPKGPQKVGENETLVDETGKVIFKGGSGGPKLEAITGLRKEIQNLPSYKNVAQAAPIYKTMLDAASRDTKAADLNLIYGLGKIMDPTSVVREGELVLANDTQGVGERLNGMINSINGGARLGPEARKALMQEAFSRIGSYKSQFDNDATQFTGIATRNGMDLRDILPNIDDFKPFEPAKKKGDGGTGDAKSGGATTTMAPVKLPKNATPDDVAKRLRPGMQFIDPNGVLRRVPDRASP